jgi:hypothetical protein
VTDAMNRPIPTFESDIRRQGIESSRLS